MRQVGPYVSPDATVVAIDMATSPDVDPPGPVGVVVTDSEILLVASGPDGGHLTKLPTDDIARVVPLEPEVLSLVVRTGDATEREVVLDFRYFGVTDDTISKLRARFAASN